MKKLFSQSVLTPSAHSDDPVENTVTAVLADRRGSCAALVATTLLLIGSETNPLDAVLFRDHVVLASNAEAGVYFETLRRGKVLDDRDLSRYEPHPPGVRSRVSRDEFVAYHLDNLAARLADADRREDAEAIFRRALAAAPESARIRYNWGTFLLGTERSALALDELNLAIRLGWKDADAFANRGSAYWELGRERRARKDFRRALRHAPGHRQAASNLRTLEDSAR